MKHWQENPEEFEDIPEDYLGNDLFEEQYMKEMNNPDFEWPEDIVGEDIAERMADLRLEDEQLSIKGSYIKNLDDFDEMSEEYVDEHLDEGYLEYRVHDMNIPDVNWDRNIEQIEDPLIKEKEIQAAAGVASQEKNLDELFNSGEITEDQYLYIDDRYIRNPRTRAITSSALESGNFHSGYLGDIANELHSVSDVVEKAATRELVGRTVETLGAESVQNMADQLLEDGKISKDAYNSLSQEIGFYKE